MIQFISFVFGTLNLAQLQFWEDVAAVPQLSCDKKNVKIFTNKVGPEKKKYKPELLQLSSIKKYFWVLH